MTPRDWTLFETTFGKDFPHNYAFSTVVIKTIRISLLSKAVTSFMDDQQKHLSGSQTAVCQLYQLVNWEFNWISMFILTHHLYKYKFLGMI